MAHSDYMSVDAQSLITSVIADDALCMPRETNTDRLTCAVWVRRGASVAFSRLLGMGFSLFCFFASYGRVKRSVIFSAFVGRGLSLTTCMESNHQFHLDCCFVYFMGNIRPLRIHLTMGWSRETRWISLRWRVVQKSAPATATSGYNH